MKPRLLLIFLSIVLIPAGLIAWLGWRVSQEEQHRVQREFTALMQESLQATRSAVDQLLGDRSNEIFSTLERAKSLDKDQWQEISRNDPWIRQMLFINSKAQLQFPDPKSLSTLTERERSFLQRTEPIWQSGSILNATDESGRNPSRGWHTWYWNDGLHFIAAQRDEATGEIIGAEIERMRLMSEVLENLPAEGEVGITIPEQTQIQLTNMSGEILYRWGRFEPVASDSPITSVKLNAPLQAWTLEYYSNLSTTRQNASRRTLVNTFALLSLALAGSAALAFYFYRETCRQMREASQRVTFVNQVSHELKTPLTNIRMYAEMLESKLDADDNDQRKSLDIIVSESQRLSRLITNVLSFSQSHQEKLSIHHRAGVVDDTIRATIDHFRPRLDDVDFEFDLQLDAAKTCRFDPDALEQILTNLLNNIEKYAKQGNWLRIESSFDDQLCEITVSDRGPGIPQSKREMVFQPFERLNEGLSDTAGTGIGLSIARDLARLHGGDLINEVAIDGATFRLTFLICPSS